MTAELTTLAAAMLGIRGPAARQPGPAPFVVDPALLAGPVGAHDAGHAAVPAVDGPYPQALVLAGQVRPGGAAPRCRPLFPGNLTFLGGPAAARPAPDEVSRAAFPGWNTDGVLLVDLADPGTEAWLRTVTASLPEAMPTRMWYGTVRLTAEMLFDALPVLAGVAPDGPVHRQRVSQFLRGEWSPALRPADGRDPSWLPRVVIGADGRFTLTVTAARVAEPFDGTPADLDAAAPAGAGRPHPAHPRNGALPARLAYQVVAAGGGMAEPLPASVGDASLRYHLVRFTRIWLPREDCSVHFPWQVARVGAVEQRLAAHGLHFVGVPPGADLRFAVSLSDGAAEEHRLRWLDGATRDGRPCWRRPGAGDPVPVDLSTGPAHIVTRRPMAAMVTPGPYPNHLGLDLCTYYSITRAVKALINNRIAGGRLTMADGDRRAPAMRALVNQALAAGPTSFRSARADCATLLNLPVDRVTIAHLYTGDRPPELGPRDRALWCLPALDAFFPDKVDAVEVGGSKKRDWEMRLGTVAYVLWQTTKDRGVPGRTRNIPAEHLGRGGAGALVVTGLADGYFLDPGDPPDDAAEEPGYVDGLVGTLTDGTLTPGSVLQGWFTTLDYLTARSREEYEATGHSMVFLSLQPPGATPTKVQVIDQYGRHDLNVNVTDGNRQVGRYQVWAAAEWAE